MATSVIFSQTFIPRSSVKLGRFITNIDEPHQHYHDPAYAQEPEPIVQPRESYVGSNAAGGGANFKSTLTSLLSAGFSKRAKTQVSITADRVTTYILQNSDDLFFEATENQATRVWIERAVDRGYDIYMIVGFHTATDGRITRQNGKESEVSGKATVPVSFTLASAGAAAPLANLTDPSIEAGRDRFENNEASFLAPGEQVCAFQYRKIQYKWLSSRDIDTSRLSKTPRWSSVEAVRGDDDEEEEDVIEVEATSMKKEELDGHWESTAAEDGEVLLMRD